MERMKKSLILLGFLIGPMFSMAGGFQVNTQGQKALSMGGSVTGFALDGSASFFNPGAMSALDKNYLNAGFSLIFPKTTFLGKYGGTEDLDSKVYTPFYCYGTYKFKEKITFGLSINTPFGLGTKWKDDWSGRYISQSAQLNSIYFQPTIAYKLSEKFSVGVGPEFVLGSAHLRKAIPVSDSTSAYASTDLKGAGTGFGFNAGIYYASGKLSLGLSYRSQSKVKINKGDATFSDIPSSLTENGTFPSSTNFKTDVTLPSVISFGVGFKITDKILVTGDLNFTGWSAYDSLIFTFPDHSSLNSSSARKYKDVFAIRAGGQYIATEKITLRGGIAFDQSPVQDGYVNPDLPDANKLVYSTGLSYQLKSGFSFEGTLMYESLKQRKESDNVENNFNGTYKSTIFILGLGVQYVF